MAPCPSQALDDTFAVVQSTRYPWTGIELEQKQRDLVTLVNQGLPFALAYAVVDAPKAQHNPFRAVYDSKRRSVYLMIQRIQRHPFLAIFDGADPAASTALRLTSTTPLQAFFLLNEFVYLD